MKTHRNTVLPVFFLLFVIFLTSCTPKQASAETSGKIDSLPSEASIKSQLEELGFHVFPEPLSLNVFTLQALSGSAIKSTDFAGTVTLLNFWATWCPPCKREMPSIQRLHDEMQGTAFRIVAVSTGEDKNTVASFIAKNKYTFPIYLDETGTLGSSFASEGIPSTYILDKSGKVIAGIVGSREYDTPAMISLLQSMVAQ